MKVGMRASAIPPLNHINKSFSANLVPLPIFPLVVPDPPTVALCQLWRDLLTPRLRATATGTGRDDLFLTNRCQLVYVAISVK